MQKLQVEISANNRPLKETLSESKGLLNKFSQDVAAVRSLAAVSLRSNGGGLAMLGLKGFAGVAGVAAAAGAAVLKFANQTAEATEQAGRMAEQYGIGAEQLSRLAYAANIANVDVGTLGQGLKGLSVKMREAANGSEEAKAVFKALGVEYADAAGRLRPVEAVLMDVADAFKRMPDGAEKAALATKLMEEAGIKMIPVLNQGADAIKRWADEATRLGLVITPEQLKAAREYEENMRRLSAAAEGLRREIGNGVVPAMANFSTKLLENRSAGLGWWDSFLASFTGSSDPAKRVAELTQKMNELQAVQQRMASFGVPRNKGVDDEIGRLQKVIDAFGTKARELASRREAEEASSAGRRADIEQKLVDKKTALAKLMAYIATGEGGKIEANEKASVERRIAEQQKLVDAVLTAWKKATDEAEKARTAANKLKQDAADVRQDSQDQANARRNAGLPEEEKSAKAEADALKASEDARFNASNALFAALHGRAESAAKYADQALKDAERATKLANQITDDKKAADYLENAGESKARALEAQAKLKLNEADEADKRAADLTQQFADVRQQLADLQQQARAIEVTVEIAQAKATIADLEAELDKLPDSKTVTVNVVTNGAVPAVAAGTQQETVPTGHARGGLIQGPGTSLSDSILARLSNGEYVMRAAAVSHYGMSLMDAINRLRLPRFASGGPVGFPAQSVIRNLQIPAVPSAKSVSSSPTPITLVLDGQKFPVQAKQDVARELTTLLKREALKRGGRR